MDFDGSSQARSWLFDAGTLMQCRQKAVGEKPKWNKARSTVARVRSFASGFHGRVVGSQENLDPPHLDRSLQTSSSALSVEEQEMLVRFHALQIAQLVGPRAVFRGLVRSSSVLATAIMLFRRFYMSNSVLDFDPRRLAVAAAYLATKIEEQRVELDLLERATALIERKMAMSSLAKQESYYVSYKDIEQGERELMEGINYEMRCHHPHAAIRVLSKEMSTFLYENESCVDSDGSEERNPTHTLHEHELASPRQVHDFVDERRAGRNLYEKSIAVAQNALLFTDVAFLVTPGPIAFASVAVASRNGRKPPRGSKGSDLLSPQVREFLRVRFPAEEEYDLRDFEDQVVKIVQALDNSTVMDTKMLAACQTEEPCGSDHKATQICEIRRVSSKVSALRVSREAARERSQDVRYQSPRKRKDADEPLVGRLELSQTKIPKVTPTRL